MPMPVRTSTPSDRVTIRKAAELIGVHENTLRKWADRGIIKTLHLPASGYRRVPTSEVDRVRAEIWRDVPEAEHPGTAPKDVPMGVFAEDGFDEDRS
jgi:hypothetical protein